MSTENNYVDVRLFYSKTGSAKYISHLDTMRAFQRAFRRCRDLDFWYTEGFNPHLYLTFALPLSLGYESGAETVDFRLASHVPYREVVEKLNAVLPAGFKAYKAAKPVMNAKVIRVADYNISFTADGIDPEAVLAEWYGGVVQMLYQRKCYGEKGYEARRGGCRPQSGRKNQAFQAEAV